MTEWEFTADVASWINEILRIDSSLPFSGAKCEQRGAGSQKRRDLSLLDKNRRVVLTGEVKLPFSQDGGSPYNAHVVRDARAKARRATTDYFFTWNVNECVLWETTPPSAPWHEGNYRAWDVTKVHQEEHLELAMTEHAIREWLGRFLLEFAQILRGQVRIGHKTPDEKFIDALESALSMPIHGCFEELQTRYPQRRFKTELDRWMRDDRGWTIRDDPDGVRENLESAAKFACYALINKLVFHEALLKRFHPKMQPMSVPEHLDAGENLRVHLESFFAKARDVTNDYETVFGETWSSIGNRIPFYSDHAVPYWRELITQIHEFDFTKLDHEVIGHIFERLIGPERRRKYGQFYTRVEVVDLINSFCIRTGTEKVMDPACGGGTFLVRAYARKRELAPARAHTELLSDLFGVDKELFATHLTTINLATRDLIDEENYPQVARSDFFDVQPQGVLAKLPKHARSPGLGAVQQRQVEVPSLDAVVGNPPYVRQEQIPRSRKNKERGTKEYYQDLVKRESRANLSGRSDIHCYFWPHAASFLKEDGYLCFLTSSQWLDVEYGFRLQEWILRNFEIVAILESISEPWFVGARVSTAITILRRQRDEESRNQNTVRFVVLGRPIGEILAHDGTTAGACLAADGFRDEILSLKENTTNHRFRARLVPQRKLWEDGVRLGMLMKKSKDADENGELGETGAYYGGKWGIHLRAPDLWFEILETCGEKLVPLGEIADIRFGIKSGKDEFFFPEDVSAECLKACPYPHEFEPDYGVPRSQVESGKVKLVRCGEGRGEIRPIEARFLEPEIHSLMEVTGFTVSPEDCARMILLVGSRVKLTAYRYLASYIKWGEKQHYHEGSTCAARASESRAWYDLTGHERGALFWPMAQQYKHVVPANEHGLICNHNLFDVFPRGDAPEVLAGILNSSWVVLSKFQYGRPVGVEGNLKTEVVDVNLMLVPDPRPATPKQRERVAGAFRKMKQRKALQFLPERRLREMAYRQAGRARELEKLSGECELNMDDRWALDHAVLELLGVRRKEDRRSLLFGLYHYLEDLFEAVRQKEEKAIANKKIIARRGRARPEAIAREIHQELKESHPELLIKYDPDFYDSRTPFDTYDVPVNGMPKLDSDIFTANGVAFTKGPKVRIGYVKTRYPVQDELVVLLARTGVRGLVRIPHDEQECRRVRDEYESFIYRRDQRLRELIEERTADEDLQTKITDALAVLLRSKPL